MTTLKTTIYKNPLHGGNFNGDLVTVIGEKTILNDDGRTLECYLYDIDGYKTKNGLPFVALKPNIYLFN